MVVKMMRKWSPWRHLTAATTAKFEVAVKRMKLELVPRQQQESISGNHGDDDDDGGGKCVAIRMKWKGEPKFFPMISRPKREDISSAKRLMKSFGLIQWDNDDDDDDGEDALMFKNNCSFTSYSTHGDHKFEAWEVAFDVLYAKRVDQRAKKASVIGKVVLDIGEIAWKTKNSSVERKLPLSLQMDGCAMEATLTVLFSFAEVRKVQDPMLVDNTRGVSAESCESNGRRRRSVSVDEITADEESDYPTKDAAQNGLLTKSRSLALPAGSDNKRGWFSWTSKKSAFKRAKTKDDRHCDEKMGHGAAAFAVSPSMASFDDGDSQVCLGSQQQDEDCPLGSWEEKEIVSRDAQTKLKASVFFASFDQCSDRAAGEGACTTLVAVISHWLHSNDVETMPNRLEFDSLIMQGSSEWRKLCQDSAHASEFPNKHFDLETVLRAGIRPVTISHEKSFVGFFGAETFETLKGSMSFDEIWDGIERNSDGDEATPKIYVVSWNDHFFVLKAEAEAYYIIDTLGERLYEGCDRAYVLRFDDSTIMTKQTGEEEGMIICRGKECCREFIKRFLASIPLEELVEEEKRKDLSYFSIHSRLQIEFNYTSPSYPQWSSSTSSPFSSPSDHASDELL